MASIGVKICQNAFQVVPDVHATKSLRAKFEGRFSGRREMVQAVILCGKLWTLSYKFWDNFKVCIDIWHLVVFGMVRKGCFGILKITDKMSNLERLSHFVAPLYVAPSPTPSNATSQRRIVDLPDVSLDQKSQEYSRRVRELS